MASAQVDLERQLEELGYEGVRRGKHMVARHPTAGTLVFPSTVGRGRAAANALAQAKRLIRQSKTTSTQFVDWLCARHGIADDDRQRLRLNVSQEVRWFAEEFGGRVNEGSLAVMARQHWRVTPVPQPRGSHHSVWEVAGRNWVEIAPPEAPQAEPQALATEPVADVPHPQNGDRGNGSGPHAPDAQRLLDAVERLVNHNDAASKLDIVLATVKQQRRELDDLIGLLEGR